MSTGDFTEALEALLGPNARGLSAKTVTRLKADWWKDYEAWQKRDLGARRFLYIWADGVYFKPRMAEEKQCVLVIVGADEYGRKELLAMTPLVTLPTAMHCRARDGFRESTQSPLSADCCAIACRSAGREVLLDLKRRGLKQDPKLAIHCPAGDLRHAEGVLSARRKFAEWGRRRARLLDGPARSVRHDAGAAVLAPQDDERAERDAEIGAGQGEGASARHPLAGRALRSNVPRGWQAETKAEANVAFDFFVETYGVKWDKAVAKLVKDRDALLTCLTTTRRNTGSTSGRQTRSRAPSPPSGTAETHQGVPQPKDRSGHGLSS